jgi:hypothetical protein
VPDNSDPLLIVTRHNGDPESLKRAFAERYERSNHGGRTVPEHVYFTVSGTDDHGIVLVELFRDRSLIEARWRGVADPQNDNKVMHDSRAERWVLSLNHCYPDLDRNVSAFKEAGFTVSTP